MQLGMYTRVVPVVVAALALGACSSQPNLPIQVTPVQGTPSFLQPTAAPGSSPAAVQGTPGDTSSYPAPTSPPPPTVDPSYPAPTGSAATPAGGAATPAGSAPTTPDGRPQTALTTLDTALQVAREQLGNDAQLFGVMPSSIMIANIGNPPVLPGWFYKFKLPGQRRELLVQIVNGQVSGSTLAEPIGDLNPAELPLDRAAVTIDSDKVLEQFAIYAKEQSIQTEGKVFDLELVNLQGSAGPTWSVVDPANRQWLLSINAVTGERTKNPRG